MNIEEIEKRAAALPAIGADDIWRNDSGGHLIRVLRSARDSNKILAQLIDPSVDLLVFLVNARQDVLALVKALRTSSAEEAALQEQLSAEQAAHAAALRAAAELAKTALEEQAATYEQQSKDRQAEFELADAALRESIEATKNEHASHVAALLEEHTAIVEKMKAEQERIVKMSAEDSAAAVREVRRDLEERLASKCVLHAQDMDDLKADRDAKMKQLEDAHAAQLAEKDALATAAEAAYLANLEASRDTTERLQLRISDLESLLKTADDSAPSDSEEDAVPSDDEEDE